MTKLTPEEIVERVKKLTTYDFLSSLTEIAKIYGWSGDYQEVGDFIAWIYETNNIEEPDLEPYEKDNSDNIIIP